MFSLNSNKSNEIDLILKEYETISRLKSGQKLTINDQNHNLEVTQESSDYLGRAFWGVGISLGLADSNWNKVAERIETVNKIANKIIDKEEGIPQVKIDLLKHRISEASQKLKLMGENTYANKKEAKQKFIVLSNDIQNILNERLSMKNSAELSEDDFTDVNENKKDLLSDFEDDLIEPDEAENFDDFEVVDQDFAALSKNKAKLSEFVDFDYLDQSLSKANQSEKLKSPGSEEKLRFLEDEFIPINDDLEENSLVLIKNSTDIIHENFSNLPNFDIEIAKKFISQIEGEFGNIALSDDLQRKNEIEAISKVLKELKIPKDDPHYQDYQQIMAELITLTLFPPLMQDGRTLRVMSFDKLMNCLDELKNNPKSFLEKNDLKNFHLSLKASQKIYLLSHLNFSPIVRTQIEKSPLYNLLLQSPALLLFLINSMVHTPQRYDQNCVGTSYNLWVQRKCATIGEMIAVLKVSIDTASENLKKMSKSERDAPAYEVLSGTAPTKGVYVKSVLDTLTKQLESLEVQAVQLTKNDQPGPREIAKLTQQWNFIMQEIHTIMQPNDPKIYSKQAVTGYYYTSAAINLLLDGGGQLVPGNPKIQEKWKALSHEELKNFSEVFFGKQLKKYIYGHSYSDSSIPQLNAINYDEMWKNILETEGCFVNFYEPPNGGHTIFVTANYDEVQKEKGFNIYDPLFNEMIHMKFADFKKYLEDRYEKLDQKSPITHAMYHFKS